MLPNLANLRRCMEAAGSNRVDRIPFDKVEEKLLPPNPIKKSPTSIFSRYLAQREEHI